MQIVLIAIGTRGDVQPMLALGQRLLALGHHVRMIAGVNFTSWVESYGLEMAPSLDIQAVMSSEDGQKWVEMKNNYEQFRQMKKLLATYREPMIGDIARYTQDAELIISGFLYEPYVMALQEKRGTSAVIASLQPYRPTRTGEASLMPPLPRRHSSINYWAGKFYERFMWLLAKDSYLYIRQLLGLRLHIPPYDQRLPLLHAFSSTVVPPTDDTDSVTTGYWFLDEPYTPPANLAAFLEQGTPPIYFGFGSMPNRTPQALLTTFSEALRRLGQRGVVVHGWSSLSSPNIPDNLFVLDGVPHNWLFPRMAAVIHHGGAGTTAAGLRAGKPSLLLPHMADQPYWARRLHELGVSPPPLKAAQLQVDSLTERLRQLVSDTAMQQRAAHLGEVITAEDGLGNALHWLERYLH